MNRVGKTLTFTEADIPSIMKVITHGRPLLEKQLSEARVDHDVEWARYNESANRFMATKAAWNAQPFWLRWVTEEPIWCGDQPSIRTIVYISDMLRTVDKIVDKMNRYHEFRLLGFWHEERDGEGVISYLVDLIRREEKEQQ
jgi:hypothetical protein